MKSGAAVATTMVLALAALTWPSTGAAQPRSAQEVQSICLKEVKTRIAYHLTPEHMRPVLKLAGATCCQEMAASAAKLSPIQRGLVWATIDKSIALMEKRPGGYRATMSQIDALRVQLTIPQGNAARKLLVDELRCQKRVSGID